MIVFEDRTIYSVCDESFFRFSTSHKFDSALRAGSNAAFKRYVAASQWGGGDERELKYYEVGSSNVVIQIASFGDPEITVVKSEE